MNNQIKIKDIEFWFKRESQEIEIYVEDKLSVHDSIMIDSKISLQDVVDLALFFSDVADQIRESKKSKFITVQPSKEFCNDSKIP